MNTDSLKQFLLDSNSAGYAGGDSKQWIKNKDGSTTIPYEKGTWKSDDTFYGGEPYGGRIIVFYEDKPYWMMVYYGWVEEGVDHDMVYNVLQNALKQMPPEHPFRGPEKYNEEKYIYTNAWKGDVAKYSGEELIAVEGNTIYTANYMGGLVDQRK